MRFIKNKFYILPLVFLFTVSCSNDFLEKNPHDRASENTFWKTKKDVEAALAGCYNALYDNPLFNNRNAEWAGLTDNAWEQHSSGYVDIARGPLNPAIGGLVDAMYTRSYEGIAKANFFLANIETLPFELDSADKTVMIAEVRFLRGLFYFYLSQLYGGVPIITTSYNIDDELIMRSSQEQVEAQILDDLDFAIENLSNAQYSGNAVKGSAQLLKIRVLMSKEQWAEAANLCKSITGFSLYDNYKNIFQPAGQDGNPEIMFSTKYMSPTIEHENGRIFGWWNRVCPYQNFVDLYECTDGLSIDQSPIFDPDNPYDNRDPRLSMTIFHEGQPWEAFGLTEYNPSRSTTGYGVRKLWEEGKIDDETSQHSESDIVLMRYAEVLLSLAESLNESEGPIQEVYDAINAVRSRPGVNMPPLPDNLTKDEMREKIRNERRLELAFEGGLRYFDLKRWRIAESVLNGFEGAGQTIYTFEPHNYLWPIPLFEIDYFQGQGQDYGQNPGY